MHLVKGYVAARENNGSMLVTLLRKRAPGGGRPKSVEDEWYCSRYSGRWRRRSALSPSLAMQSVHQEKLIDSAPGSQMPNQFQSGTKLSSSSPHARNANELNFAARDSDGGTVPAETKGKMEKIVCMGHLSLGRGWKNGHDKQASATPKTSSKAQVLRSQLITRWAVLPRRHQSPGALPGARSAGPTAGADRAFRKCGFLRCNRMTRGREP